MTCIAKKIGGPQSTAADGKDDAPPMCDRPVHDRVNAVGRMEERKEWKHKG